MTINLTRPFGPDSNVEEYDVRQIKKALNRLGYYQPYEKTGMAGIPDKEIFASLKTFQKDYGIKITGEARPDDETIKILKKNRIKPQKAVMSGEQSKIIKAEQAMRFIIVRYAHGPICPIPATTMIAVAGQSRYLTIKFKKRNFPHQK